MFRIRTKYLEASNSKYLINSHFKINLLKEVRLKETINKGIIINLILLNSEFQTTMVKKSTETIKKNFHPEISFQINPKDLEMSPNQ
jgi:hypothetical protein